MSNNSTSPKGQRTKIFVFLANWSSEMFHQRPFEENLQLIETLKECYLISDWANDRTERTDVLLLFKGLEQLFQGLEGNTTQDYKELDQWILKQTA